VVRICQFIACAAAAALALGTAAGWMTRGVLLGTVLVIGAARTFENTTMQAVLPGVVPLPMLPRATAAASSATQVAVIAGPVLGGLIYALDPVAVYAVCSALYLSANLLLGLVRVERTVTLREPLSFAVLFAGFSYIRRNKIILGAISLDLFAVILGGAFALLPVFARDVFHTGSWGLGLLRAAPGVGALAAAVVLTRWPLRRRVGKMMFGSVALYGVAIIVFALSRSLPLSMAALCLLGMSDMVSVVIRMTVVQLQTPDDMRGRVSAVNSLFVTTANQLGEFRAGLMAAWLGTVTAVMIGGVGALLAAVIGRGLFAELYRADSTHPPQA
jgi:MFS family permease